jgi:hypothetical protein
MSHFLSLESESGARHALTGPYVGRPLICLVGRLCFQHQAQFGDEITGTTIRGINRLEINAYYLSLTPKGRG